MRGRRRLGFMTAKLYLTEDAGLSFDARRRTAELRGRMWPIRRIRFLIGTGRFRRPMGMARSGGRGWWRTSGL